MLSKNDGKEEFPEHKMANPSEKLSQAEKETPGQIDKNYYQAAQSEQAHLTANASDLNVDGDTQ